MKELLTKFGTALSVPTNGIAFGALVSLMVIWYVFIITVLGIREQGDANNFQIMANAFMQHEGNLPSYFKISRNLPLNDYYPAYTDAFRIAIVALIGHLKLYLGETWRIGFIVLNVIAMTISSTAIFWLARWLKLSLAAAGLGALLLALNWEHVHWVAYVGTDVLFLPFASLVLFLAVRACLTDSHAVQACFFCLAFLLASIALTIRPAGLWLFTFLVLAMAVRPWIAVDSGKERRRCGAILFLVGLALAAIAILAGSFLIDDPDRIGNATLADIIARYAGYSANGEVIRDRPETFIRPPSGPLDHAKLILLKYVYYFAFAGRDFSTSHYVYNHIFFATFFSLAFAGSTALFHRPRLIDRKVHVLGMLSILFLIVFASAHAMTIIDFDWRYRIPCYIPLTVLSMIAAHTYLRPIVSNLLARQ